MKCGEVGGLQFKPVLLDATMRQPMWGFKEQRQPEAKFPPNSPNVTADDNYAANQSEYDLT